MLSRFAARSPDANPAPWNDPHGRVGSSLLRVTIPDRGVEAIHSPGGRLGAWCVQRSTSSAHPLEPTLLPWTGIPRCPGAPGG